MSVLFLIVFVDLIGFGVVIPLLPYYALHFHASPLEVTSLMACYSFAQFFSSPILGRLSDKLGRKPVLVASLVCSVCSYIWLGLADALWMIYAARLLAGAGAGNIAAAQAYITDITTEDKRAKGMGMIGAAFGLGFTLGPAFGGMLAGDDPTNAALARPALAAAFLSGVALILTLLLLKESLPAALRGGTRRASRFALAREAFSRTNLRHVILLFFWTSIAFAGVETTFALWATDVFGWGPKQVGWVFFFVGLVLAAIQGGLIGRLTKRFGERQVAIGGTILLTIGLAALPFSFNLPTVLAVMALLAAGMGLLNPTITSLVSKEAGSTDRGGILGVNQSAQSLSRILGPLFAGLVYSAVGRDAPYYGGAIIMVAVVVMAMKLPRGEKTV